MATKYAVVSGNWSNTAVWSNTDGGVGGATVPANNDTVIISAGISVLMDVDQSAFPNGIAGVTIRSHATTPGMLYFKDGTNGYLKLKTLTSIQGTNVAGQYGRLLVNSDGVWGNTTPLSSSNTAIIFIDTNGNIQGHYLNIAIYGAEPTTKYIRTYGSKFTVTVNATTNSFTTSSAHGFTRNMPVMFRSIGGSLPTPLQENRVYLVAYNPSANTFQVNYYDPGAVTTEVIDLLDSGSGTIEVYNGHQSTSTDTINVLDDISAEAEWTIGATVCLSNLYSSDFQKVTIVSKTSNNIRLSANIDSIQHPNSFIILSTRNVSILGYWTGVSASPTITYLGTTNTSTTFIQCEMRNLTGTSTANNTGAAFYNGTNIIFNGIMCGFTVGMYALTNSIFSGISASVGSTGILYLCTSCTFNGKAFGLAYCIRNGVLNTLSGYIYGISQWVIYTENRITLTNCFIQGTNVGVIYNSLASTMSNVETDLCTNVIYSCSNIECYACIFRGSSTAIISYSTNIFLCSLCILCGSPNAFFITEVISYGASITYMGNVGYASKVIFYNVSYTPLSHIRSYGLTSSSGLAYNSTITGGNAGGAVAYTDFKDNNFNKGIYSFDDAGQQSYIKGWNSGGTLITEPYAIGTHGTPPAALSLIYKFTYTDVYQNGIDIPISGNKNIPMRIKIYVKKSVNSMTVTPYAKICDKNTGFEQTNETLVLATMADNTNWQTLILEYTPTYDKQLVLRIAGTNASGILYWNYEIEQLSQTKIIDSVLYGSVIY